MNITKQNEEQLYEIMFLAREFRREYPGMEYVIDTITLESGQALSPEEMEALHKEIKLMETFWNDLSKSEKLAVTRRVKRRRKARR
jgi:hypothetical protein|tara:strand:- start:74 stop:331 length:258 start_codon:yes stop_codon:yes gene_type:complete